MPKITINPNLANDNAIASSGTRNAVIFQLAQGSGEIRWSFGTSYTAADSQRLCEGDIVTLSGTPCQQAFSFYGGSQQSILEVTTQG